jgi:hypothetical protein
MAETSTLIQVPEVIGLPPWNLISRTNEIMLNSMPIAEIYPSTPRFKLGQDLFRRVDDFGRYKTYLRRLGYTVPDDSANRIKVAFIADSFPTDTFQNEYGENFLQKFTDVASEGAASIAQFLGARSLGEGLRNIGVTQKMGSLGAGAEAYGEKVGGMLGSVLKSAGSGYRNLENALKGSKIAGTLSSLAAGGRIDFPQVWKTSSFQPSYTMTVRLYNPFPQNDNATRKYIVGPIAALALCAVPISIDGSTYNYPFIHRIKCEGVYDLDPAFISSIAIVKGGDQQNISYNQRMAVVDVRIDFGSLYGTILAGGGKIQSGRPTLEKYIDVLEKKRRVSDRLGERTIDGLAESPTRQTAPTVVEGSASVAGPRVSPTRQRVFRNTSLGSVLIARDFEGIGG